MSGERLNARMQWPQPSLPARRPPHLDRHAHGLHASQRIAARRYLIPDCSGGGAFPFADFTTEGTSLVEIDVEVRVLLGSFEDVEVRY